MITKWTLIILMILPLGWLYGKCNCPGNTKKTEAQNEVTKWIESITNQYPVFQKEYDLTILVSECTSLGEAMLCDRNQYYIFYNQEAIKKMRNTEAWNEKFTLAHELAHILQGHSYKLRVMGKTIVATQEFQKNMMPWGSHLEEFQADALATFWFLQQNAQQKSATEVFEALRQITPYRDYWADDKTHPSLKARKEFIIKIWKAYQNKQITIENANRNTSMLAHDFYEEYLKERENKGELEESDKLALKDLEKWGKTLKSIRSVANDEARAGKYDKALEKRKELDSLYQVLYWSSANEQEVKDNTSKIEYYERIVKAKGEWGFFLTGGIGYAQPTFKVAHRTSAPYHLGLTIARLTWYQPHGYEVKLTMRQQEWQTFLSPENTMAEEQFDWRSIDIVAAYTYRSASRYKKQFYSKSSGWYATVGGGGAIPNQFSYQNKRLSTSLNGTENLRLSPIVTASLGFEKFNRRVSVSTIHWRTGVAWQFSPLKLKNLNTNEPIGFHQLNVYLNFRFL